MKAVFLKDEYQNLWFFYAEDVKVRSRATPADIRKQAAEMACVNSQTRELVMKELESFKAEYTTTC